LTNKTWNMKINYSLSLAAIKTIFLVPEASLYIRTWNPALWL